MPKFSSGLADQNCNAGGTYTYTLPAVSDPEGSACTVTASYLGGKIPSFVTFSANTFTITPAAADVGKYQIDLDILDEINDYTNFFVINVVKSGANSAPTLSAALTDQTMIENNVFKYTMPVATDPDGDAISWTYVMPSFGKTLSGNVLEFSPVTGDYSDYLITVNISDPTHTVSYTFHLIVN